MTPVQEDAQLGLLAAYAFDMFPGSQLQLLEPPADPRLSPLWAIRGYLTACDALFLKAQALGLGTRVFYGFLAESTTSPGTFVAVVRGTADIIEWAIDAKFAQVQCPLGGHAEAGFYGLFETLKFRTPGGVDTEVGAGIAAIVGKGSITVIGHSLGAALATYLALELAAVRHLNVRGRFFASPRPGDQDFADAFATHVKDAVSYARERDEVPEVPFGFGYLPLHCLVLIGPQTAQAVVRDNPLCNHHIFCYCADLWYGLMAWPDVPPIDQPLTACICGPATH